MITIRFPQLGMMLIGAMIGACNSSPTSPISQTLPKQVDFNFHIKPILSDRCFACHGPDENTREAGLRLDTQEGAFAALGEEKDRFAIVAGKLEQSELHHRIHTSEADEIMPPPESNLSLTNYEKKLLDKWIEQGAAWKDHWAFIPPQKTALPQVRKTAWVQNEIDYFILDKMENMGFVPEPKASKEKRLRRLSFDLIGLPPSVEEVEAFLEDTDPNAYEKQVDRLLASPHYGERMASIWLDAARYSDSHGYQDDRPRTMWPWRDWVVNAYNTNLSYDKFLTWQLAGDLLPNATYEQKLATGFNRNHAITQEGGVVNEEYVTEYVADRTQTAATAFLGITLECARCHDHKYDPISQKEYYQMFAFFNTQNERGQINYFDEAPVPNMRVEDAQLEVQIAFLDSLNAHKTQELEDLLTHSDPEAKQWMDSFSPKDRGGDSLQVQLISSHALDELNKLSTPNRILPQLPGRINVKLVNELAAPKLVPGISGKAFQFDGHNYLSLGDVGDFEFSDRFSVSGWVQLNERLEKTAGIFVKRNGEQRKGGYELVLTPEGKLQASLVHNHRAEKIEVLSQQEISIGKWVHVCMVNNGSGLANGIQLYLNGKKQALQIISDNLQGKSILNGNDFLVGNWTPRNFSNGTYMGFEGGAVDEVQVYSRELSPLEVHALSQQHASPTTVSQTVQDYLAHYRMLHDAGFRKKRESLDSLRQFHLSVPKVMIMEEMEAPRETHLLARGRYDAPTERVFPSTPNYILAFPDSLPPNRLGLAKWMTHPQHPLTSRVAVNRIWQMLMGQGLVKTPEDFGSQGALPTHAELLDWLAVDFQEKGWDVKALIKQIVLSATYQQQSTLTPRKYEIDPENLYLARGPNVRLNAEMLRDQALAISGLFNPEVGGKWVKPYQPAGVWKELANQIGENKYRPSRGQDVYRRSLYTYWKRTIPPPAMLTFDAAERAVCTVKRQRTSTPLQALVLLNDPQYVEASHQLAKRMLTEGGEELEQQLEYGFRLATSRVPERKEITVLAELYETEYRRFQSETSSATALLNTGYSYRPGAHDPAQLAGLTVVANLLLNLDESKMKS